MELTEQLTFDDPDREDLYNYVERHGRVTEAEVRRGLNLDPSAFGHHLTVLRRQGYVRKVGDELQIAHTVDEQEEHAVDGDAVTVRTAEEDDREALVAVVDSVASEGSYIEAETVAAALDYDEAVIRHNDVMSRLFFVAEVGDDVVGWVHLDLPEAEKLAHTAQLTVGLRPDYRGRGLGQLLLDRGVRWAREHGYEKLYNSVPSSNERAISFLEDHGWEIEAVRKDHYRIEDEYVDEVMMAVDPRAVGD
ncbi:MULTISPECIES: GNAT family N-acetyltransferase [Halolamina]|uniref:Acetyltransferase (GNAT) domain-containing protein n=1 Tax=Halolamina pelagica TaxID=699431 RepID=A0A1I5QB62_9EURY|nr:MULTISPECIES: GNAT family N-acetyltransferase [Halolamina]NHX35185.1 GNAT family N-acetyltransferase [Halolamina sp. R1-12]SFP43538.1 Acetyltransferase (GNAT) domain-containing protein [Halolamina pelagica]